MRCTRDANHNDVTFERQMLLQKPVLRFRGQLQRHVLKRVLLNTGGRVHPPVNNAEYGVSAKANTAVGVLHWMCEEHVELNLVDRGVRTIHD